MISTVERAGTKPAGFAPEPSRGSALYQRQEALREKLFEASRRLEALELGEPIDSDRRWREARLNRGRGIT